MGGLAFNLSTVINMFLFCDLNSPYTWIFLFLIIGFSLVGLTDDIIKVFFKDSFGFRGSIKLILELLIGVITILTLCYFDANYLDNSIFYKTLADSDYRSLMNVVFTTGNKELDLKFVTEAKKYGLENLKGHKVIGGLRASIYNAMPLDGVLALVDFMKKFEVENNV